MKSVPRAVALAAATLALAFAGCKKDEKKTDQPADPKAAETTPGAADPATPAPALPPGAAVPEPGLSHTPAEGATPPAPEPGQRPASITEKHIATADKVVEVTRKFATELDTAKGDCKKATAVLKSGGAALASSIKDAEKVQTELSTDHAAQQWLSQTYGPKMMVELQKLGPVMEKCRADKDFDAAFRSLELGGGGAKTPPPPPEPSK
jgi:hypothetical protein